MRHLFTSLLLTLSLSLSPAVLAETVLKRGNGAEPETLDIHKSSGVTEANIQRDMFEGLVVEDAFGKLQPGMAEKWEISSDGKTYTFHLRDALWSDGTPVTADDFVFAYRRALDPATASDYAFILWAIANAEAYSKGEIKDPTQLGIKALDPKTLEIRLKAPTPYFLGMLMHPMAFPLPQKAVQAAGNDWIKPENIRCNGAYCLSAWQPQAHVKLSKNPHYRRAKEVAIDTVYYIPTEDQNSELKRFRAGELDITNDVPADQIKTVQQELAKAFRNTAYIGTYYYALNLQHPAFKDNPKLRRALSLALDRDILTTKITQGGEIPAWGWTPAVDNYTQQSMEEQALDKAAREKLAKELYAESGYSADKPLELEILYNTSDNNKKLAIAVAAMWKQVLGVKTNLRNEEWKVYLNSRRQKQFQVVRASWIGDYNDAHSFLSLFKSDVGEMNTSGYANPEYDRLLQEAENQTDPQQRRAAMEQAERVLLADMPLIPVYFNTSQHLVSSKVRGWEDNIMDVHHSQYLRLE